MGTVVLKAEILYAGKGCPVCGEKKTAGARTCRTCYNVLGREITRRVDAVNEAVIATKNGHQASQNTETPIDRDVVWGPILAQVKIGKDASLRIPRNEISNYWECQKSVKGGSVYLFVFGAEDTGAGNTITAWVELKIKDTHKGKVSYLRAQAVQDIRSDVKLAVGQYDNYIKSLPATQINERGRLFSVGFVSV